MTEKPRAMTCGEEAYREMVSELPPELRDEDEYRRVTAEEDEADYIEFLGLVLACQRCRNQNFGSNCILCPDRPFGKTPCRPDLKCYDECGGPCRDGAYCDLILVCDHISDTETPLADLAMEMCGDLQ